MSVSVVERTQAGRSRETRRRLMEAVVGCLVERGWAGTTTSLVAERAGVSRGAMLHHFASRGELVAAAVQHVGRQAEEELLARGEVVRSVAPERRTRAVVELIADFFISPVFAAALELWVAARTDEQLRAQVIPLQAQVGRETHRLAVALLGADESRPGVREAVQATLDLARGLALADQLVDDRRRRRRVVAQWAVQLERQLAA